MRQEAVAVSMNNFSKYLAELLGTFILVFCGAGSIMVNQQFDGAVGHMGISLTFGLVVMAMIYALGKTSGAHINPAVTLAFWAAGLFKKSEVPGYLVAQFVGAIMASMLLGWMMPDAGTSGETLPGLPIPQTFVFEFLLTYILMLVILFVATGDHEQTLMAGAAIGAVVGLEALFAGPATGASMNPARSLGPALASGNLDTLWIYFFAPILGALAATGTWLIFNKLKPTE